MERKVFDMNRCRPGDQLITKNGAKVEYVRKIDYEFFGKYFHCIAYTGNYDRLHLVITDEGRCFGVEKSSDNDIVGFWEY